MYENGCPILYNNQGFSKLNDRQLEGGSHICGGNLC